MADNIQEKVKDIIVEQLGVNPEQVTLEAKFIEDLGADSLDTVELVMAFEEEFGIDVPDEEAEKLQAVGDVVRYVIPLGASIPFQEPAGIPGWLFVCSCRAPCQPAHTLRLCIVPFAKRVMTSVPSATCSGSVSTLPSSVVV